jgi:hypothetical protein
LCVPLALIFVTEAWIEVDHDSDFFSEQTVRYLLCVLGSIVVQLSVVVWLSLWIGLWCRTRLRALATTLSAIIGWSALPFVLLAILDVPSTSDSAGFLYLLSPLTVPALNEMNELDQIGNLQPWTLVLLHLGLYGSVLVQIRTHCLRRADAYLRR